MILTKQGGFDCPNLALGTALVGFVARYRDRSTRSQPDGATVYLLLEGWPWRKGTVQTRMVSSPDSGARWIDYVSGGYVSSIRPPLPIPEARWEVLVGTSSPREGAPAKARRPVLVTVEPVFLLPS